MLYLGLILVVAFLALSLSVYLKKARPARVVPGLEWLGVRICPAVVVNNWKDTSGDHLFSNAQNWSQGFVPGGPGHPDNQATFDSAQTNDSCTVDLSPTTDSLVFQNGYTGTLTLNQT